MEDAAGAHVLNGDAVRGLAVVVVPRGDPSDQPAPQAHGRDYGAVARVSPDNPEEATLAVCVQAGVDIASQMRCRYRVDADHAVVLDRPRAAGVAVVVRLMPPAGRTRAAVRERCPDYFRAVGVLANVRWQAIERGPEVPPAIRAIESAVCSAVLDDGPVVGRGRGGQRW